MPAGDTVLEAVAIDTANVVRRRAWSLTVSPVRTDFEFSPAVSADDAARAADDAGAQWFELDHTTANGTSGFTIGAQSPAAALDDFKEDFADQHDGAELTITSMSLGGDVSVGALGALASKVVSREVVHVPRQDTDRDRDADPMASSGFATAAYEPMATLAAATQPPGTDENWRAFAPSAGTMRTDTAFQRHGYQRRIRHTFAFSQRALDEFKQSFPFFEDAYEHDLKFLNPEGIPGVGGLRCNKAYKQRHWALRDGWFYDDDIPGRTFRDTAIGDPCPTSDMTVLIPHPRNMQPDTNYHITARAKPGALASETYELYAQRLRRDSAKGSPEMVSGSSKARNALLIGKTVGRAPECRTWRPGTSSQPCP